MEYPCIDQKPSPINHPGHITLCHRAEMDGSTRQPYPGDRVEEAGGLDKTKVPPWRQQGVQCGSVRQIPDTLPFFLTLAARATLPTQCSQTRQRRTAGPRRTAQVQVRPFPKLSPRSPRDSRLAVARSHCHTAMDTSP